MYDHEDDVVVKRVVRYVALCSRVSWSCYMAGGSDAPVPVSDVLTLLPPLLDPEPVLDMFDSESDFGEDLVSDSGD